MTVKAVVKIQQFDTGSYKGNVREQTSTVSNKGNVREIVGSKTTTLLFSHLPAVTNPVARSPELGWPTPSKNNWSDSPTRQPLLLYRHRFSFGRDNQELFSQDGRPPLASGTDGDRWGNLDSNSGVLMYEEAPPVSNKGSVREFSVFNKGHILERVSAVTETARVVRELSGKSGDVTLSEFPFLLVAEPEPFSIKNPVDTDVFIRLSNYTFPLASGTITLRLDGVLQSGLQIQEFFGGLGGFNVTWPNVKLFDYDAQVNVHWEFLDTDFPPNRFIIRYPFFTVPDLAGPRVSNLVPEDNSSGVPVTGPIQFEIEDFENDVDISSLVIYINNLKIIDGENGTIETTELISEKGFTVKVTPAEPWLYGDLIPVAIFVKDTSKNKNETFFTYSFKTAESSAPRLINTDPAACAVVPVESHIRLDVIDGGHGLDKTSLVFTVEEEDQKDTVVLVPIVHRDD